MTEDAKLPPFESADFRKWLTAIDRTQTTLVRTMKDLGDYRTPEAILRSVQRMASGTARVSGEMSVILRLLARQWATRQRRESEVVWAKTSDGNYETRSDGFNVRLTPETRGRWSIALSHPSGYSPPWPRWETSIEKAKERALTAIDEATRDLDEIIVDRRLAHAES